MIGGERVYEYAYRVYESVINATSSELILFFVILAVVAVPLYIITLKGRKAERQHEREEKKLLMEVIQGNSEAMTGLKAVISNSEATTNKLLEHLATGQNEIASKVNKILIAVNNGKNNQGG